MQSSSEANTEGFPSNHLERQEAYDPFYPRSSRHEFLDPEAAIAFYKNECKSSGLLLNHSFIRFLKSGSLVMEFENGYLGENGIGPIMATLKRIRLMGLLLPQCALEDEQIQLICETFAEHPSIEAIDLRGNRMTVTGSKHVLRLVMKNKRITDVKIDPETPKSAAILQRAAQNGAAELSTFSCLICQHPVVYTMSRQVEITLLKTVLTNFSTAMNRISAVQVEVLFRLLLMCCEVHNGLLALCSETCMERMSKLLYESLAIVTTACYVRVPYQIPNNFLLKQCLPSIINDIQVRYASRDAFFGVESDDDNDVEKFFGAAIDQCVNEECSVCGHKGRLLKNGVVLMMRQLVKELDKCEKMSPSGFLRLSHVMVTHVQVTPCSRKCVRQLVRFGIYGFYGLIRAYPKQEKLLSSLGIDLDEIPEESFSVVDFSNTVVDSIDEEETTCALTVASAMEDIDNVPIDPYMIFAIGRHLRHQAPHTIGMELQSACEAVRLVGCLAQEDAPFKRRFGDRPPRRLYANWEDWDKLGDVRAFLHAAFARRRTDVFCVDGPYGNAFDNIRGALWAFREQHRSVVAAMKFSYEWLVVDAGVVPETSSAAGGFYTTVKIVGQTLINNSLFLIVQGNFGESAGQKGYFYIPKSVFNRHVTHNAYIFVDVPRKSAQEDAKDLYAAQLVEPSCLSAIKVVQYNTDIFSLVHFAATGLYPFSSKRATALKEALSRSPLKLAPWNNRISPASKLQELWQQYFERLVLHCPLIGQLVHFVNEICPAKVARFLQELVESSPLASSCHGKLLRLLGAPKEPQKTSIAELKWVDVLPESMEGVNVSEWGSLLKKRKKKGSVKPPLVARLGRSERPSASKPSKDMSSAVVELEAAEDAYLRDIWESEKARFDVVSQKPEEHHYAKENLFPWACSTKLNAQLYRQKAKPVEKDQEQSIDPVFLGRRWNLLHVTDQGGAISSLIIAVIHHSACIYDLEQMCSLTPLSLMASSDYFSHFPFANGFDASFHHPQKPRFAYVFANDLWIEWDAYLQRCVRGPFQIQSQPMFSKLPPRFYQRVDSAIPVPGTPFVIFICQNSYVLFNLETSAPEGAPQTIPPEPKMEDSLFLAMKKTTEAKSSPAEFPAALAGKEIMAVHFRIWAGKQTPLAVICADGVVHSIEFGDLAVSTSKPITDSSLRGLPLEFKQMTVEALPVVCRTISEKFFQAPIDSSLINVTPFSLESFVENEESTSVTVTSQNMKLSSLAESSPTTILLLEPSDKSSPLLSYDVHYRGHTVEKKHEAPLVSFIQFDLGEGNSEGFSSVIVLLDVSKVNYHALHFAPIAIVVESSWDDLVYQKHTVFRASKFISFGLWRDAHVARFWRLRFVDPLPPEVGVCRVFWYKAASPSVIGDLPVLETYVPLVDRYKIEISAEMLLRPPQQLLNGAGVEPVFATAMTGWFDKHAVLPLLPHGDTCLFFCGTEFVEFDMNTYEVVDSRTLYLESHPAFACLPHPFSAGFDALFYTNVLEPNCITLIRDGYELQWDIFTGKPLQGIRPCSSGFFKGCGIDMTCIYAVINVWTVPGEVDIIFSLDDGTAGITRWNINGGGCASPPKPLQHVQSLNFDAFHKKPLLTLFSLPKNPTSFFAFCETLVGNTELFTTCVEPRFTKQFLRLTWRLFGWSRRRSSCAITIDFFGELELLLGVELVASSGCKAKWRIECSDDGFVWDFVGTHIQTKPRSRTTWLPRQVRYQAHRFWRFTCDYSMQGDQVDAVAYKLLSFLSLPLYKYKELSRSHFLISSTSRNDLRCLLNEKSLVTFDEDSKCSSVSESEELVHHISVDYGAHPALLASLSWYCRENGYDAWSVFCSDEGAVWNKVGSWKVEHQRGKLTWYVGRAFRFWRVEVKTEKQRRYANLQFHGYKGPFISIDCQASLSFSNISSLLPLLYETNSLASEDERDYVPFNLVLGSTISLDTKAETAALVGLKMICAFSSAHKADFVVEHSNDFVWWFGAVEFSLFGSALETTVFWNAVGSHRFWRCRLISSSSEGHLLIKKIIPAVSKANLYRMYLSQKDSRIQPSLEEPEALYLHSPKPISIVRVEVNMPPNSMYVVEKLCLDSISWEQVALLKNRHLSTFKVVDKGWEYALPTTSWRVRFVQFCTDNGSPIAPQVQLPVKWFSFTNQRLARVPCEALSGLTLSSTRFDALDPIDSLLSNKSGQAVLQMIPPEEPPNEEPEESDREKESHSKAEEVGKTGEKKKKKEGKKLSRESSTVRNSSTRKKDLPAVLPVEEAPKKEKIAPLVEDPTILFSFESPTRFSQVMVCATTALPSMDSQSNYELNGDSALATSSRVIMNLEASLAKESTTLGDSDGNQMLNESPPQPPLRVMVEISDNQVDFFPITSSVLFGGFATVSWYTEEKSKFWRLRFANTSNEPILRVSSVKWFVNEGVASALTPSDCFLVTNSAHKALRAQIIGSQEAFYAECRRGYDQAKSVASKLREENDIEPIGTIAKKIWQLKKSFHSYWRKVGKIATRTTEVPEGLFIGATHTLPNDLNFFFYTLCKKYEDCVFLNFIDIVKSPFVFKDMVIQKKDSHWYYPSFEVAGTLQENFYGFSSLPASFTVLWHLSPPLLKNLGPLTSDEGSLCSVSPTCAAPLITLSVENETWKPAEHFPFFPFLYHCGYAAKPTHIIFSLSEIESTEKFYLRSPTKSTPVASQSYHVYPGVNFVRVDTVGSCPAPIFELLKRIYPETVLNSYKTPLVLSSTALSTREATFRFTLPAKGVNFGIEGLQIGFLSFEVSMSMLGEPKGYQNVGGNELNMESLPFPPETLYTESDYHVSFISREATFRVEGFESPAIPIGLTGSFDIHGSPVILLEGMCASCSVPLAYMRHVGLAALRFTSIVSASDEPQAFLVPRVKVTGNFILPSKEVYSCHYELTRNNFINATDDLHLDLNRSTFEELFPLSTWARSVMLDRAFVQPKEKHPYHFPCFLYASLRVDLKRYTFHGNGMVRLWDAVSSDASIVIDSNGFRLIGSAPHVRLGNIELHSDEGAAVLLQASANYLEGSRLEMRLELTGTSNFFCPKGCTNVSISKRGAVCLCSTPVFDLYLEENVSELVCSNAQVILHGGKLLDQIVEYLKAAPMIVALLAHGLPFCLSNEKLFASNYSVLERRLCLRFKGVFFGAYFEVSTPSFDPSSPSCSFQALCEELALRVIEECRETIWASYGSVVGCVKNTSEDKNAPKKKSTFVSKWLPLELD